MIKIPNVSGRFRGQHFERCEKFFRAVVDTPGFDASVKTGVASANNLIRYLDANLYRILVGTPAELQRIMESVDQRFAAFSEYCTRRPRKGSKLFDPSMVALCELVRQLFDYERFSAGGPDDGAYALIREYNQRLCPYCHLQCVNYHIDAGKGKLTMRPDLDHFYPRSKYPYLGISLSNLIPACRQCNTSVKRAKDPRQNKLLHPLEQHPLVEVTYACTTALPPNMIVSVDDFVISLTGKDKGSTDFIEFFELAERYKWYGAEVMDVFKRYQRYLELDGTLRNVLRRTEFLLGYAPSEARQRIVGSMLSSMVQSLP
jgi:5-methylcytosine-specific restriction endonuclease McrA